MFIAQSRVSTRLAVPSSPESIPMFYFVFGIKKPIASLLSLELADRTLRDAGYNVFDPVRPGKITVAASHVGLGILVTVLAIDAEGGTATTINSFCTVQASVEIARITAETIVHNINNPFPAGQVHIPRLPHC